MYAKDKKKMNGLRHLPILFCLALSACGGGGGGGEGSSGTGSGGDGGNSISLTLPMATGDRWLYSVTWEPEALQVGNSGEELVHVTGTKTLDGVTVAQMDTRRTSDFSLLQRHFLHASDTRLEEHFPAGGAPYGQTLSAVSLLHFPLVTGESFLAYDWQGVDIGADHDGDGINESLDEKLIVTVVGREAMTTLQGIRYTATRVTSLRTSVLTYSQGSPSTTETRTDEWLVDGIGVVRRLVATTDIVPGGLPYTQKMSYDLVRYNVGGHRSELQAPQVDTSLRAPAPGSVTNDAWLQVRVPFTETIDVSAITTGSLVIENSSGEPMPGDISANDHELTFRPSSALPDDLYTVSVRGIPDVIGNTLGLHNWTFTVDTTTATDPQSLVPLAVDDRWIYDVRTVENFGTPVLSQRMETVTGTTVVQGHSDVVLQSHDTTSFALLSEFYVDKRASGLSQLFKPGEGPFGLDIATLPLLHLPVRAGDSYTVGHWSGLDAGRDYDGDGLNEILDATINVTIGSQPEFVSVAAGHWPSTTRVTTEIRQVLTGSLSGGQAVITRSTVEWLAPGVGTVRRVRTISTPGYIHTTSEDLAGYRVGNTRSESMKPWPRGRTPIIGTNVAPTTVSLNVDEPLDLGAMASPALAILNSAGQPVAGTLQAGSRQLRFVADSPLPDDRYHVAVADLIDLVGNRLEGQSWDFTVDTTRPRVLAASIADGAVLRTSPVITLSMSESLPIGWSSSSQITLKTAAGADIGYTPNMNGTTLTITPALLQHGTTYTLTLTTSLRDSMGNTLASPYSVTFSTPPALLQMPTTVIHTLYSSIAATAIGDVDDDGRNDLVIATSMSSVLSEIDSYTLHVFLQQANGTLTAPLKTKTFNSAGYGRTCPPSGLGIGDVTGDGKTDIVLGESGCGIKIIERAADGSWPNPLAITALNTQRLQYMDMNGDGEKDVVGFNASNANLMSIWYRQAGGGLGPETSTEIAASHGTVSQLHDMNGDGRPDIVLNSPSTMAGQYIGIMLQAADGSFGAPAYSSTGAGGGVYGFRIADLNGDGRPDMAGLVNHPTLGPKIAALLQQADGSLQAPSYFVRDLYSGGLFLADINNDGRQDALTSSAGIGLYLQDSSGQLQAEDRYASGDAIMAVGDLNSDGKRDVVTMGYRTLGILYNITP